MKTLINLLLPVLIAFIAFAKGGPIIGFAAVIIMLVYYIRKHLPEIYILMAKFNYLKDNEKMFALLEKAYKTGRMKPDHKIYYGYMCMREGKYDEAERLYNAALALQKDEGVIARAKTNVALLLWKKGSIDDAVSMMGEVYEKYKSTVVYGNYGYLLLEKKDLQKALEVNLAGYEYDSQSDIICDNLAQNYYMLGNYEESRKYAEEVIGRNPQFPMPYYNYAKTLVALGEKEKATEMLKKALTYPFSGVAAITKEEVEKLLLSLIN